MDTLGELISRRVVTGFAEQRLSLLADAIRGCDAQYCAVIAPRRELLGIIRFSDVAARTETSNRILSDLMRPCVKTVLDLAPAEEIQQYFEAAGMQEICVQNAGGEFVGLITPESFAGWLLRKEQLHRLELVNLLAEHRRLAKFLEDKIAARIAMARGALNDFEEVCVSFSHDVRPALQSIQEFSQMLTAEAGEPRRRDAAAMIQHIAAKTDMLAGYLLARAQHVFGEKMHALEAIDLNEVFADTQEFLDARIRTLKASVVKKGRLATVSGHYAPILQIFLNLVENSLRQAAPGQPPVVEVWTESVDGQVHLLFQDGGLGISRDAQESMFRPFMPATDAFPNRVNLCLKIAGSTISAMGGQLTVSSKYGMGTLFTVAFARAA